MSNLIKFVCKACGAEFKTNDWSWDGANEVAECPMCKKMCPCVIAPYRAKGDEKELSVDSALAGVSRYTEITNEIESIDKRMTSLRQEMTTLEQQRTEALTLMSAFVHPGAEYYTIDRQLLGHRVVSHTIKDEHDMKTALGYFRHDGYYTSRTTVHQLVLGLSVLNKLAMLHDLYCPDYTPDWDSEEPVYTVALQDNQWVPSRVQLHRMLNTIYYPNSDVAQQVCDYLNVIKYMLW